MSSANAPTPPDTLRAVWQQADASDPPDLSAWLTAEVREDEQLLMSLLRVDNGERDRLGLERGWDHYRRVLGTIPPASPIARWLIERELDRLAAESDDPLAELADRLGPDYAEDIEEAGARRQAEQPPETETASMDGDNAGGLDVILDLPDYLQPGRKWGKFLIEEPLGRGGQAVVVQAYDRVGAMGHVALKVSPKRLNPERAEAWARNEAKQISRLDHSNIIRVVDAACIDGIPYVATALVNALSMDAYVKTSAPTHGQILKWIIQLCDAIHAAHTTGIVHCDLKPRNVLITPDGQPLILDFGVASMGTAYEPTQGTSGSGTPQYMAPEQARIDRAADHRMDVFGLGGVLKFLLDGRPPIAGDTNEQVMAAARDGRVCFVDAKADSSMARQLARIANRALQPNPQDRYPTARDMRDALRRLLWRRRMPAVTAAAAAAALLLAGIGWMAGDLFTPPPAQAPTTTAPASQDSATAQGPSLDIHFQRKNQTGSYQLLTPDLLPLNTGDRVQVHATLPEPMYAAVAAVSASGHVAMIYPPLDAGEGPRPVSALQVPPGRDQWLPLEPPAGTETLVLLASRGPLGDLDAIRDELQRISAPPVVADDGLLVADARGVRLLLASGLTRDLGQKAEQSSKGFIDQLLLSAEGRWDHVRVLAFPHGSTNP